MISYGHDLTEDRGDLVCLKCLQVFKYGRVIPEKLCPRHDKDRLVRQWITIPNPHNRKGNTAGEKGMKMELTKELWPFPEEVEPTI